MTLTYYRDTLKRNAKKLARRGKGILAVDESTGTVGTVSYTHLRAHETG